MQGEPISAANDLISSVTYIGTTSSALQEIINKSITGLFNIADKAPLSKYQLLWHLALKFNKYFASC